MNGRVLHFYLAGINNQNFLMRDKETGTWWQQITGKALYGPLQRGSPRTRSQRRDQLRRMEVRGLKRKGSGRGAEVHQRIRQQLGT